MRRQFVSCLCCNSLAWRCLKRARTPDRTAAPDRRRRIDIGAGNSAGSGTGTGARAVQGRPAPATRRHGRHAVDHRRGHAARAGTGNTGTSTGAGNAAGTGTGAGSGSGHRHRRRRRHLRDDRQPRRQRWANPGGQRAPGTVALVQRSERWQPGAAPSAASSTPQSGGANNTPYAAHTTGSGYSFGGIGFDLNNATTTPESSQSQSYNASAFSGITFWAKGTATLRVEISQKSFVPTDRGGSCSSGSTCWNVYGTKEIANRLTRAGSCSPSCGPTTATSCARTAPPRRPSIRRS